MAADPTTGTGKPGRRPARDSPLGTRRRAANLSQAALAELTGASTSTIGRIERGDITSASLAVLANCAHVLGCQIEDLIDDAWREWVPIRERPTPEEIAQRAGNSFRPNPPWRSKW